MQRVKLHYCANFCYDHSNHDWFSTWQICYTPLDHPLRLLCGVCHFAKFGWNWCSGFDNMPCFDAVWVWFENAISTKPQKGTSLRRKISYDVEIVKIAALVWPVCVMKRWKNKSNLKMANWVFSQTTHIIGSQSNFLWGESFGVVLRFKFHQSRLSGFWDV